MDNGHLSRVDIESLQALCSRVEETAGMVVNSPARFEALSLSIFNRTGEMLSPTTLKRIWGYLREPVTPRHSTLDILARYCGWQSYLDFAAGDTPDLESGAVGAPVLRADKDVTPGDRVKLMWSPMRVCIIEYLGNRRWKVAASERTRLQPGDVFSCAMIVSGEPLYLDDVEHAGIRAGVYVCGRKTGVKFVIE